jgi:hypothetical protein
MSFFPSSNLLSGKVWTHLVMTIQAAKIGEFFISFGKR